MEIMDNHKLSTEIHYNMAASNRTLNQDDNMHSEVEANKERRIDYQVLKLHKVLETRTYNNQSILALGVTKGLQPISPETEFREGLIRDLLNQDAQEQKCEFLIVVAMYNESAEHFTNTMIGVHESLNDFYNAGVDPKLISCVMIVDGVKPFMQTYNKQKPFFSQFFDENAIKKHFKVEDILDCKLPDQTEYDEFAHCFAQYVSFGNCEYPLNFILCVKQFNRRKLNTHLWFFGGFCEMVNPKFVMLLDVGTKPSPSSLFYLYEAMVYDKQLAGCCGEIKPMDFEI